MVSLLFPRRCLVCGDSSPEEVICRGCLARCGPTDRLGGLGPCRLCGQIRLAELEFCVDCSSREWTFPALAGLCGYQEPAAELVRLYKFGGLAALGDLWLGAAVSQMDPRAPLVPVPSLRRHRWARGWDPVGAFVRRLAARAGVPVWNVLARRASASQKSLDRLARRSNAESAYALAPGAGRLRGVSLVWLVDDVVTTGATVEACTRLLRTAGVAEVRIFSLGLH